MDLNSTSLDAMFKGFNTIFNKAHTDAAVYWPQIAMKTTSEGASEVYGWLSNMPQMREWVGDRVISQMARNSFSIENRKFEATVKVARESIEDDRLGVYAPQFQMMAHNAAAHPDELVFDLLKSGFEAECYDGQPFFDADHPVRNRNDVEVSVSNMQAGASVPWFLLDTSRPVKPVIYQERLPYKLQSLDKDGDTNVFMRDEYLYGLRARVSAGFGLWQFAFGSKAALTPENYASARAQMQSVRYDQGRIMGVSPTLLVVPPLLESAARQILKSQRIEGSDNEWAGSAELLVSPYLAD